MSDDIKYKVERARNLSRDYVVRDEHGLLSKSRNASLCGDALASYSSAILAGKAAGNAFSEFVSEQVDPSERATIGRKVGEVLGLMSADGLGSYPHRLAGKQIRSVKIRRDLLS